MVLGVWETTRLQQGHKLSADGVWGFFMFLNQWKLSSKKFLSVGSQFVSLSTSVQNLGEIFLADPNPVSARHSHAHRGMLCFGCYATIQGIKRFVSEGKDVVVLLQQKGTLEALLFNSNLLTITSFWNREVLFVLE